MSEENGSVAPESEARPEPRPHVRHMDENPLTSIAPSPSAERPVIGPIRWVLKGVGCAVGLLIAAIPALSSGIEARLSARQEVFVFWGQLFALVPGVVGNYLRKCYYVLTLQSCTLDCEIGFLSYFTDRRATVARGVYIGVGAYIATAVLGEGTLIGSRVSILSGKHQHRFTPDGRLMGFDHASIHQVHIGAQTWIGEGAVLMADVGSRCIVAAGSVVSNPVPDGCTVGGNPARFVGKTGPWANEDEKV